MAELSYRLARNVYVRRSGTSNNNSRSCYVSRPMDLPCFLWDSWFTVSGVEYRRGYYLADGIYPQYSTIVKTVRHPADEKRKKFAKFQEAARKDIVRCFGVLQQRWHIIENPARAFTPKTLRYCMYACILLHNMILKDEGHAICEYDENAVEENNVPVSG
ncbi:putative harbinger transposase-derived protein [Helianthus anomalus]